MGIPFTIVEGVIFIADKAGNIVGTKNITGELDGSGAQLNRIAANSTLIGGSLDGGQYRVADIRFTSGANRLLTDSIVQVDQVFGQDNFADTWFWVQAAGINTDTWTIHIDASATDSTSPDRDVAAYNKVITCTATEAGDEIKMRDKIIAELNSDVLFSPHWKATAIKDNAAVHISSKYIGEFGERLAALSFTVTTTGSAVVYFEASANQQILRRGKKNSGVRDPRDKRLVTVGISGEVQAVPGAVGDLFIMSALNGSSSASLLVNGNLTPTATTTFTVAADSVKDIFIEELRFFANGNGIKFGQMLAQNIVLTNGVLVEIRSDEIITQLPLIKQTDDLKHKFAFGMGNGFALHIQSGRDDVMASLRFSSTFPLRKAGTYASGDDYIKVFIRDNCTSLGVVFEFICIGFKKDV